MVERLLSKENGAILIADGSLDISAAMEMARDYQDSRIKLEDLKQRLKHLDLARERLNLAMLLIALRMSGRYNFSDSDVQTIAGELEGAKRVAQGDGANDIDVVDAEIVDE